MIEAADLGNDVTINAIEGVRFTPAGEEAARAVLASSASGDALWAATWVYASSAADPAPLGPLLNNADASIRAMAASALVALGEDSGFAVLAASVSDADRLRGSVPPLAIGSFALSTLSRYVAAVGVPAEPATEADLAAAAANWAAWLREHENQLTFDATSGTWNTP